MKEENQETESSKDHGAFQDGSELGGEESTTQEEAESERSSSVSNEADDCSVEQLHLQLATLTNSLSTLSSEKSKMEAGFQADKKKLRHEKEEV